MAFITVMCVMCLPYQNSRNISNIDEDCRQMIFHCLEHEILENFPSSIESKHKAQYTAAAELHRY